MSRAEQPVARLGWVLDGEFAWEPRKGPARLAADSLVAALRELQRVEPVDESVAETAMLLGEAVDADPTNAALWGQFRAAQSDLRAVGAGDSDGIEKLIAELSAGVPNPAVVESSDARGPGGSGVNDVGPAVHGTPAVDSGRRRRTTP